ncbi:MAG: hypothetical protein EA393_12425 [Bacteroidetes bacterium]|nr:MAG: hypothetical protein EA393_12425 [Bacteroidota bacterium]
MRALRLPLWIVAVLMLTAISVEPDDRDQTAYVPIFMKKSDLPNSVFIQEAREFETPGKIYIYGNMIYIVDLFKGIHIIDNQDPSNPLKIGFLYIPGVMDLAIRNNVLFADNSIDLVSIDISSYPQISILDRVAEVFPEPTPPDLLWIPWAYSSKRRPENTVIVAWVK